MEIRLPALLRYLPFGALLCSAQALALDTQVTLTADTEISPTNSELVTFGLPIAEGEVMNISEIRVLQGGTELAAHVEADLRHHWSDNSIRSVTIQLQDVDMRGGDVTLRITDAGASVARLSERPHSEGWTNAGSDKANLPYPRVFALHDPAYLGTTGIIPPFSAAPEGGDAFEEFQVAQFNNNFGALNYSSSSGSNWLFDRSSAMFKVYMTTGRVEFLKEAFLSKQFYFTHVRNDGAAPAQSGGDGCWTYGVSCSDGKYIAPQQAKLALALVGDDSQWDNELLVDMALQADLGWNQYGARDPFDYENEGFTERGAGLVGLAEIVVYEMTGDETILSHLNERVESLRDMQQTVKPWDTAHGWVPKSGGFDHNIQVHEGAESESSAPVGDTNARGFSAWMSENIADFLWQTYWITGNESIPGMLTRLANAVDLYGFSSVYNAATGQHTMKPEFAAVMSPRSQSCNTTRQDTDAVYMASAYADAATRTGDRWYSWYSDNHNIEMVLILATGYYFETDEATRARLQSRIEKLIEGWSNENCARVFSRVYRLFNWQHRSNSVRTWDWIAREAGVVTDPPVTAPPPVSTALPVSPPGFAAALGTTPPSTGGSTGDSSGGTGVDTGGAVGSTPPAEQSPEAIPTDSSAVIYRATASCSVGDDPHWQCGGQWTAFSDLSASDFVAVCPGGEGTVYSACEGSDRYVRASDVTASDGYFTCLENVELGTSRGSCNYLGWKRAASF